MAPSTATKVSATIQSVLVFLILSLPATYTVTNRLLGGVLGELATESGCPTTRGVIVHSLVFGGIIWILMLL